MAKIIPFAPLDAIKPYKTSWRIQVKILHSWKQYTKYAEETLEMILADSSVSFQYLSFTYFITMFHVFSTSQSQCLFTG